jgi:arylformamidase
VLGEWGLKIIDISPTISEDLAVWPGDAPYQREISMSTDNGDHLSLSKISTTLHLGAHADAPNHYAPSSPGIAERSLHSYIGPVQVEAVTTPRGQRVELSHLRADFELSAPRILFKTGSFPEPNQWNEDFCSLSVDLIDFLVQKHQVLTVGIDTPSIDPFASKKLEAHQAVLRHNLAILEGLVLSDVEPGLYTLVALPLKLAQADASPVRAVLLPYQIFNELAFSPPIA